LAKESEIEWCGAPGESEQVLTPDIHRTLPHSVEAEQGVLGSMLISPRDTIAECVEKINEAYFYVPAHQTIYTALVELWNAGQGIDLITFTQILRDRNILDAVGGAPFVTSLFTFVPTAANIAYYLDIVREKFIRRQAIASCTNIVRLSYEESADADEVMSAAQSALLQLTGIATGKAEAVSMRDNVMAAIERLEQLYEGKVESGLTTGFSDLDAKLGGLHRGEVVVIAGDTAGGKTTLAHNIIDHVAVTLRKRVQLFSYEMPKLTVTNRMLAARARVNTNLFRTGKLTESDFPRITAAAAKLAEAPISTEDDADSDIEQLRARARRLKATDNTELIVVDYVQKVPNASRKDHSRQREVAQVSDALQKMAMELNIPVIVLSQLNEDGKIREARDIAFDAKTVLKILPPNGIEPANEGDSAGRELKIVKNNNGSLGTVNLTFLKYITKFESASTEEL